jgi:hypothetical protein
MAHGFLTPQSVSGDNFWKNVEWLWKKLNQEKEKKEKKEGKDKGGALATTPKPDIYDPSVKAVRVTDVSASKAQKNEPPALKMLKQSAVAGALGAGTDAIVKKEQLALPPGGPKLPGGASPTKGGTFTNLSGISAAPKKLDSEAFFKAAQTGVDPETGRYLSSEERKEYLKKSKSQLNATASVASAAAPGISSASSLMTKGDEAVVGSVDNLTNVVSSLVDAVKAQTASDKQIAQNAKSSAEKIANRSLARDEEKALESGTDNSGFITPTGGLGSLTGSGSSGGGGGGLGLGTALGAAGKIIGKAAPGIGARGAARALPRAGAMVAGKGGAKALMKMGGKTAARMIPGAQTAIGLGLAGEALSRGDILGAALSAGSAIPGPIGWGFLAADVARDLTGGQGKGYANGGLVTGGKTSVVDDVPIRADEGEVVMSNAAGNAWGRSTLLAMNAMGGGTNKPTGGRAYAEGGLVGGDKAKSKQMFRLFGEGMIDAQKAHSRDFAKIQSQGLRQYYENEGGGEKLGKSLASIWSKIGGVLGSLFSGTLNSLMGAANAATQNPEDYLTGAGDFSGSSGQAQAMNYFMSQGLTKDQAAGIVGNLMQESTAAIDPKAKNATGHRGIAQWDKNRWGNFEKWAKQKGLDVNTREAQLQWIMEEMRTGAGGLSLKTLKGAKTSRQAADLFLTRFERSGEKPGEAGYENRMKNAAKLAAIQDFGSTMGAGGGSKLESDILSFRQARTKFGVSANRVATDSSFNLAIRELRGASGGSSINPLADDKSYQDVHRGEAHKKGYGFDIPVGNREQAQFVINFWRTRGYETIHGRGEDPSGGHDHHVHVQAPKSKAKEFLLATKPKPKPKPAQGTQTAAVQGGQRSASRSPGALQASPSTPTTGNEVAQASASYTSNRRNTRGGGTTIINNNNNQSGGGAQVASAAPAGGSSSTGLAALALRIQS